MTAPPGAAPRRLLPGPTSLLVGASASLLGVVGLSGAGLNALTRVTPRCEPAHLSLHQIDTQLALGGRYLTTPEGFDALALVVGDEAARPGHWGLVSPSSRLLLGPVLHTHNDEAVRAVRVVDGEPTPGTSYAIRCHPWGLRADLRGLDSRHYTVDGPAGALPVTEVTAPDAPAADRAVVFVHGRGSDRSEGMWFANTVVEQGWRMVLPGYRNDPDAPATGRYLLGGEFEDLAAVLDDLRSRGVRRFVLVGWSMGGNIVASYLRHAEDDHGVTGLVLDAPALDWGAVLTHVARGRRIPTALVPLVMTTGRLLEGIDWRRLDHLVDTSHLDLDVLAFHGTDDEVVPASLTHRLGRLIPRSRVVQVEGAGHCRSVNLDPDTYRTELGSLLARAAAHDGAPQPH